VARKLDLRALLGPALRSPSPLQLGSSGFGRTPRRRRSPSPRHARLDVRHRGRRPSGRQRSASPVRGVSPRGVRPLGRVDHLGRTGGPGSGEQAPCPPLARGHRPKEERHVVRVFDAVRRPDIFREVPVGWRLRCLMTNEREPSGGSSPGPQRWPPVGPIRLPVRVGPHGHLLSAGGHHAPGDELYLVRMDYVKRFRFIIVTPFFGVASNVAPRCPRGFPKSERGRGVPGR